MNALKTSLLGIALATALPAGAQEMDHSKMAMPMSPSTETTPTGAGDRPRTRVRMNKITVHGM